MRRIHASTLRRILAWSTVLLVVLATNSTVFAQDQTLADALSAAANDYDMVMLEDAESRLMDAVRYAEREGLAGPQVAEVHVMLGIVRFARDRDEELTELAFIGAVEAYREVTINPIYETPELSRIMERARRKARSSNEGSPEEVASGKLKHEPVYRTKAGEELVLEADVPRSMPVFRMFAYWRSDGEQEFARLEMSPADAVRFVGVIPGEQVRTSQIEYYIEVVNRANSVVANFASTDEPHAILVIESTESLPDPPDEESAANVYAMLGLGSGLGLLTSNSIPTINTDSNVSAGVAPAFGHSLLDLGWILNDSMHLGLYFRYQFAPTQDLSALPTTECLGLGLPGDCLLGFRYRYYFAGGQSAKAPRFYSSVGLGFGRVRNWVRIRKRFQTPECQASGREERIDPVEGSFCLINDTVRTGTGHLSAGAGMNYPLAQNLDFVADATLFILTFDQTSFNLDANLGVAFRF